MTDNVTVQVNIGKIESKKLERIRGELVDLMRQIGQLKSSVTNEKIRRLEQQIMVIETKVNELNRGDKA